MHLRQAFILQDSIIFERFVWQRSSLSFPLKTSCRADPLGPCWFAGFAGGKTLTGRGTRKSHKSRFRRFRSVCCKGKWLVRVRFEKRRQGQLGFVCLTRQSPAKDRLCLHWFLFINSFSFFSLIEIFFVTFLSPIRIPMKFCLQHSRTFLEGSPFKLSQISARNQCQTLEDQRISDGNDLTSRIPIFYVSYPCDTVTKMPKRIFFFLLGSVLPRLQYPMYLGLHLLVDKKQRMKNGPRSRITIKDLPTGSNFLQQTSPPKVFRVSLKNTTTSWGPRAQHMSLWRRLRG